MKISDVEYQGDKTAKEKADKVELIKAVSSDPKKKKDEQDLSVKKKFFDDKLALTFRVNDIFYSRINNVNAELTNLHIAGINRNDSRSIRLTLQYTFGNIVKPNDTSVNTDEKQRIKMW